MTNLIPFPVQILPSQLPEGFDHQVVRIRDLIMDAFELATRDEILAVAKIMGLATADGTIISDDEIDNARIIEFTAFHVRHDEKILVQILLDQMPIAADPLDRAILSALATSAWSIYRIQAIQPQVAAVVVDHWEKTRQVIYSRTFQDGMKVGDAFMARRVAVGDLATMTALVSRIPEPFLEGLQKLPGFSPEDRPALDQPRQALLAEVVFGPRRPTGQSMNEAPTAASGAGGGNRQRNQPCPCRSGKKFKHCCARGR